MIILRQKQYTSILFKVKTRLGTARNYLANKLQNRIYKHSENINKAIKDSIVSLRNTGKLDTGTGIGESFRRMGEGNAIVGEELSATRKALKILKKNGATKDELNLAKTNLGLAAKTYKEGAKIHILNPIQNKIQIPSRRRK